MLVLLFAVAVASGTLWCVIELPSDGGVRSEQRLNLMVQTVPRAVISPLSAAVVVNGSLTLTCAVSFQFDFPYHGFMPSARWYQNGDLISLTGGEFGL